MYIVIDGNGILFRYIFAIKEEMYDSDGILVSGVFGFCRMLLKLIQQRSSGISIAFDKCKNNFRKVICPQYKSNRQYINKNLWAQVDRVIEFCRIANISCYTSDEFEADDIIGSIVSQNSQENFRIIAVDKDFCQLVSERVQFFDPFKKQIICKDTIFQKYGVPPRKFDLFLTLCGDSADNVKGVVGIGPKTAAKILKDIESLDQLKETLPSHSNTIDTMYSLVKLQHHVVIDPPIGALCINKDEVRRFLQYMNFNSLLHLV